MSSSERPLSPHLQIYRPQLTSVLSISHRASGIFLSVAAIALVWWLAALASGPEAFATAQGVLGSWPVLLILFVATGAMAYHLCNGIRHLMWDSGRGFDLETVYRTGRITVGVAVALTLLIWILALTAGGA